MVLIDDLGLEGKLTVADVQTTGAYAVFADGTAVGEEAGIKDVFHQRALEAEALAVVAAALRAGFAKGSGRAGLHAALQELNSTDQTDFDNMSKRVMRKNLQRVLDSPVTQVRQRQMIICGNGCSPRSHSGRQQTLTGAQVRKPGRPQ